MRFSRNQQFLNALTGNWTQTKNRNLAQNHNIFQMISLKFGQKTMVKKSSWIGEKTLENCKNGNICIFDSTGSFTQKLCEKVCFSEHSWS